MSTRKHSRSAEKDTNPDCKDVKRQTHFPIIPFSFRPPHITLTHALSLLSFISLWLLLLFLCFPPQLNATTTTTALSASSSSSSASNNSSNTAPTCESPVSVYVYDLPPQFNLALLKHCRHLNVYTDMCPHVANAGLGQPLSPTWFATHQFIAEMIFHARVQNHPCRTRDPSRATLFYVPFYAGLHASSKFREPNLAARDALAVKLADYIQKQPPWRRRNGRDHFIAAGRTAWDLMRDPRSGPDFGANRLLLLPAVKNMSVLTVERNPWDGRNQHGIPYPSYFHPSTAEEMSTWQDRVTRAHRPHLFSFVGATRKGLEKAAIRDEIMTQCAESTRCRLVDCKASGSRCYEPMEVLGVMMESVFCLQAPGDSFTRRSTFDSVLAGCVPVFFSKHTAYTQYEWFLPSKPEEYSVYMEDEPGKRIEEVLLGIPTDSVERMRRRVVDMIPGLTYAHPNASQPGFRDAVDVALEALTKHVATSVGR